MTFNHISATLLCIAAVSLTGCEDHFDFYADDYSSDEIRFTVTSSDGWAAGSRSADEPSSTVSVLALTDDVKADTLYLMEEISPRTGAASLSRGQMVTSPEKEGFMYDELDVSAYYYTGSWSDCAGTAPNYFSDAKVAQVKAGSYAFTEGARFWPTSGKMRFIGYGPSIDESANVRSGLESNVPRNYWFDKDYSAGPRMYIRVPNDAKDQQDVIVAYTEEFSCDARPKNVAINLQHPLTGIRFECGDDMLSCKIKKITFNNICRDGNFLFDMDDAASPKALSAADIVTYPAAANSKYDIWGNLDSFSLTFDGGLEVGPGSVITDESNMFFMLPQKFDSTQWPWSGVVPSLEIEFEALNTDTGRTETSTMTASLDGRVWPAGTTVTYRLQISDQVLEVEQPKVFSYLGYVYDGTSDGSKDNTVSVLSHKLLEFRDWNFEILGDGKNWLSGTKSADGSSLTFNVIDGSNKPSGIDIDAILASASAKGSTANPWNLSNSSGAKSIQNTANCYMINAKGTYVLPLVFGNAIKNGTTNTISYYNASGEMTNFTNHTGNAIFSPYIQSTWKYPAKAYVKWQDEKDLVSDVTLLQNYFEGGSDIGLAGITGIRFDVGKSSSVRQGNALIAVEDTDGNIMWSWHIWVTNLDLSSIVGSPTTTVPVTNLDNESYDIMPVNLGWCSGGTAVTYYPRRSCTVRVTSGPLTKDIEVVQERYIAFPRGNQTYYQWGRKDPFVGTADGESSKTWYDSAGSAVTGQIELSVLPGNATSRNALTETIKNPDKWHIPPFTDPGVISWSGTLDLKDSKDQSYANFWNNAVGGTPNKTIFDPSPVGYRVTDADAFTGLQIIHRQNSNFELSESYSTIGKFQTLTFYVSGYRDWADNGRFFSFNNGARGCVWSNALKPDSESMSYNGAIGCAYYMNFTTTTLIPLDFYYTCDGFPVRPCTE